MRSSMTVRGIVFSALFAAILVVLSFVQVSLGFSPVPITLETLAVMLAGAILGASYGFFSIFLVVFLTAVGLPLLNGHGGLGLILGPTGGYVWMWPINALLIGYFVNKVKGRGILASFIIFIIVEIFGVFLDYVSGVGWLAISNHMSLSKALVVGCFPFIPGDTAKAILTTLIAVPIRMVYPSAKLVGNSHQQTVLLTKQDIAARES